MIGAVNLNAAIDQLYVVEKLRTGGVNRILESRGAAGGKGMNVARVASLCGYAVAAAGFRGGAAGAVIEAELARLGIKDFYTETKSECRRCLNIKDAADGSQTEFLEPGPQISPEELERFWNDYDRMMVECQVLTLSGSVPAGVPPDIYFQLIQKAKEAGRAVLLDTSGHLLRQGIQGGPTLAKPNLQEMAQLLGELPSQQLPRMLEQLRSSYGIQIMTMSLGAQGVLATDGSHLFWGAPPQGLPVVNTVGCGDSMMAAFAIAIQEHFSLEEMVRYGVAVSAANALTRETGSCSLETVGKLLPQVRVEEIKEGNFPVQI